jgi:serine protease
MNGRSESTSDSRSGGGGAAAIVVKFRDHVELPYNDRVARALDRRGVLPWAALLERFPDLVIGPLHAALKPAELRQLAERAAATEDGYRAPNLLTYFLIRCPADVNADEVVRALLDAPAVETAYVQSPPLPPPVNGPANPRYGSQGYVQAAPGGIDAAYAWTFPGGNGAGIGFVDMERGWTLNHEDLTAKNIQVISGVSTDFQGHGTAVLGEITAVDNTIGDVGIVPEVTARVVCQWRADGSYNTADAITSAVAAMSFGDVLLLEAQANTGTYTYVPVEAETATFDVIRLATALGIVVIEAGCNGSNDLDAFDVGSGQVMNRASAAFKDSGAIMVGAASSTTPHTRLGFSNYGSRIDCYAWGGDIDTTGDGWTGNTTTAYTASFGGTSGASPIVAGAAVAVQGLAQASLGYRFNPKQLRAILSDPANSTASNDPPNDKIGRMPDLHAVITSNALNLAPDPYIRDFPADQGDPRPAAYSNSPDVIVTTVAVADPTTAFGPGSGTENSSTLGDSVVAAADNFVYLRVLNRGGTEAQNLVGAAYWSPPASLVTPNLWNLIGTVNVPVVPVGRVLAVSNAIHWPAVAVPAVGHYCFVATVGTTSDPAPTPGALLDWSNFVTFIQNNNQVAWHNFNVDPAPPAPPGRARELPFLIVGAPLESLRMDITIEAQLPLGATLFLEAPRSLLDSLKQRGPHIIETKKALGRARVPLPPRGAVSLGEAFLGAGAQMPCRLRVQLPRDSGRYAGELSVHQTYQGTEVGRISWTLLVETQRDRRTRGSRSHADKAERSNDATAAK